jgi:hypothetical protein
MQMGNCVATHTWCYNKKRKTRGQMLW